MKKLLLFAVIAATVSSCKVYDKIPTYLNNHNFQRAVEIDSAGGNKFEASIDSL